MADRILIVRFSALGDILFTLPALDALRRTFPHARIDWLCEDRTAGLLRGHPQLDHVYVYPRKELSAQAKRPWLWPKLLVRGAAYLRELRRQRYDLVLDFQANLKSVVQLLAGPKAERRVGYDATFTHDKAHWILDLQVPPDPSRPHRVDRPLRVLEALGIDTEGAKGRLPIGPEHIEESRSMRLRLGLEGHDVLVLHPFTSPFGAFKRWPNERFVELAKQLAGRPDTRVVISWGPGEEDEARSITAAIPGALTFDRPLSLLGFARFLGDSQLLVSGDTGPLHLAGLLDTPRVAIFGPKDHLVYGPHGGTFEVLTEDDVLCRPCRLRKCQEPICVTEITTKRVLDACERVLERGR
ncbi:MAG: glycosyltransferase family 9 protein [Planctomycetota bacterium]